MIIIKNSDYLSHGKKCKMKYLIENDLADNYKEIETIEKDMELDI